MTLLSIIQRVSTRIGQPRPTVVIASTEETVQRLLELAQEEGTELAKFGDWKVLRKEHTFLTTATESQTNTHTPTDMGAFIDGTIWNRSRKMPVYGPVTADEWQAWKAQGNFPVTDTFYMRGTTWVQNPVPPAGQTIAYEYRSKNWCQATGGGTLRDEWAADTDVGLLDERLMRLGIIWRYLQSRGFDWVSAYEKYMFQVQQALDQDQPRRVIDLSGVGRITQGTPGLVVPEMGWNL